MPRGLGVIGATAVGVKGVGVDGGRERGAERGAETGAERGVECAVGVEGCAPSAVPSDEAGGRLR